MLRNPENQHNQGSLESLLKPFNIRDVPQEYQGLAHDVIDDVVRRERGRQGQIDEHGRDYTPPFRELARAAVHDISGILTERQVRKYAGRILAGKELEPRPGQRILDAGKHVLSLLTQRNAGRE